MSATHPSVLDDTFTQTEDWPTAFLRQQALVRHELHATLMGDALYKTAEDRAPWETMIQVVQFADSSWREAAHLIAEAHAQVREKLIADIAAHFPGNPDAADLIAALRANDPSSWLQW